MCRILSIVLAGGAGSRLRPLTLQHAKPALPFIRKRRIIDFVLSNLWHSGWHQVWVLTQYKPDSLHRHLQQHWQQRFADSGFLRIHQAPAQLQQGTAGAVASLLSVIGDYRPDFIAILSADHIYKMDYRQMLAYHLQQQAQISVAAIAVPQSDASHFGILQTDSQQRIDSFVEKPQGDVACLSCKPGFVLASMGNYLFSASTLYQTLSALPPETACDFGHDLLPVLLRQHPSFAYPFEDNQLPGKQSLPGYWRDVGTLNALLNSKLDVLKQPDWLEGPAQPWPVFSDGLSGQQRQPTLAGVQRVQYNMHLPLYA